MPVKVSPPVTAYDTEAATFLCDEAPSSKS